MMLTTVTLKVKKATQAPKAKPEPPAQKVRQEPRGTRAIKATLSPTRISLPNSSRRLRALKGIKARKEIRATRGM